MDVKLPVTMPEDQANALKKTEKEIAQALQQSGKWRHLWRIAGQYANISIFDVDSVEELHTLISTCLCFRIWKFRYSLCAVIRPR
jgi:muconolactone D-isomerase